MWDHWLVTHELFSKMNWGYQSIWLVMKRMRIVLKTGNQNMYSVLQSWAIIQYMSEGVWHSCILWGGKTQLWWSVVDSGWIMYCWCVVCWIILFYLGVRSYSYIQKIELFRILQKIELLLFIYFYKMYKYNPIQQ